LNHDKVRAKARRDLQAHGRDIHPFQILNVLRETKTLAILGTPDGVERDRVKKTSDGSYRIASREEIERAEAYFAEQRIRAEKRRTKHAAEVADPKDELVRRLANSSAEIWSHLTRDQLKQICTWLDHAGQSGGGKEPTTTEVLQTADL
jgi:hypothetical protein